MQRHYLPVYVWSSVPVVTPATAEARIIWKTGPHRKRELATDDDVVESEGGTGMKLSPLAIEAGWKGLAEGPPQQFWTAVLRQYLPDLVFDGDGLWSFLLLPEVCGLVAFGYGLYGCFRLSNLLMEWAANLDRQHPRSPWEEPAPGLFDGCAEMAQEFRFRIIALHRNAKHCLEPRRVALTANVAATEPSVRSQSFPFPLFGVYSAISEGYLWTERDAIE